MDVTVAKTAGICFGVAGAINTVYEAVKTRKLCTYGPLIHNKFVTGDLEKKGVRIIDSLDSITDETVVIRSHGVPESVYTELESRGVPYIDCTCPYVRRIHRLAEKCRASGRRLIIAGERRHPEVLGIQGHADNCVVVKSLEELKTAVSDPNIKYMLAAQTTYSYEDFSVMEAYAGGLSLDIIVENTLCGALRESQAEAARLAETVDVMLVLGDPDSSNTENLYYICKQHCKRSYRLESIHNLLLNILNSDDKMGITAGASTPPAITEEAVKFMSELEITSGNQSFEEMLDESIVTLHTGDIVKGKVIQVLPGEVSVNLNYKYEGIIPRSEITDDPLVDINTLLKPGDEIDVFVVRVNDSDGNVSLSKKKLDSQKNFSELEEAFENKAVLPGRIIDQVKGGLIAIIKGMRVFVPSSQISSRYVEDLSVFKGKEFNFNILELDKTKRRIVAGRKDLAAIEQNKSRDEFFSKVQIGQKLTGAVSRIAAFGAFVDLGGVDGLIHISELSWGRVRRVSDVLSEGDKVTVTVIDLNKEKGKISLSLKDIDSNPWNNVSARYPVGGIVEGRVVRIVTFGAFVELEPGLDGLVHISQIASKHVIKVEDELTVGEIIKVKVTEIDEENKKISLSKREADGMIAVDELYAAQNPEEADPDESAEN
ncbi:MAG: bifunctional 4-hydroxy-3-methylbut-2-enyl diphosphate reductase/30S ribosomal protein S1 [Clostridiales bacterium]|jgi:4-hydroxy-3-methylbut-2-enyl diphosphate reductase|nr:bifunctional 4-hydroxy-3-methylbut-2-enyl diphosphate reductase/30S ribosomal protein S1 [Clostridiales bacterium]